MHFFTPDTSFYYDYTDKGKYVLIWRLSFLFIVVFAILSAVFFYVNTSAFIFYFLIFLIAGIGMGYLIKSKRYKPLFWTYTISATVLVSISLHTTVELIHYSEFFWIVSIVIFAFIGLDRRAGILFLITNALSMSSHMLFRLNDNLMAQRPHTLLERVGILIEMLFALMTIGYLLHQYLLFQSYAEKQLKRANRELAEQNQIIAKKSEENSTLAKEIHHRVKNNLQIIISLLRMHSYEVRSEETKRHFSEAINRIMSMSLIHQKLYQSRNLTNVDFESYVKDLTCEIIRSSGCRLGSISCDIVSDSIPVGLENIVPMGLLLNELTTNSLKHAFQENKGGAIHISLRQHTPEKIVLEYADNGTWKSSDDKETSFGLELIELLTNQLEGNYLRTGSAYRFEFRGLNR